MPSSSFAVGGEYIAILREVEENYQTGPNEKIGDYIISSCGNNVMLIQDEIVHDVIATKIDSISYVDLREQILTDFKDIFNCHDWISSTSETQGLNAKISPNPAQDFITVSVNSPGRLTLTAFGLSGEELFRTSSNESELTIDRSSVTSTSGLVLFRIEQDGRSVVKKVVFR